MPHGFDRLEVFKDDLYHCSTCNYCVDAHWPEWGIEGVCPTLQHHSPSPGYSGRGYIAKARALLEGEDLALDSVAERVFTCTNCGNCEEICPITMRPAQIAVALRAELNDRGLTPPAVAQVRDNVLNRQNPWGQPKSERQAWTNGAKLSAAEADVLYLPGCAVAHKFPEEGAATVALLQGLGVKVGVLDADEDGCCGAPLAERGFPAEAQNQKNHLRAAVAARAPKQIVTSGAECLAHMAAGDGEVQVRHVVDYLADRVSEGAIKLTRKPSAPARVFYMDPCHLTKKRHGVPTGQGGTSHAEAARIILEALGCTVAEPPDRGRFSVCCGASGGMPEAEPDASMRMARSKIENNGAVDAIVTASPLCAAHMSDARQPGDPPVFGLAQFIVAHGDISAAGGGS